MILFLFIFLNIINCNNIDIEFSCWFTTYDTINDKRIINLILGYNNINDNNIFIAISDTSNLVNPLNLIYPYNFNGIQPDLFNIGNNPFAFIIIDQNNILLSNTSNYIQWTLNTSNIIINSTLINNNTLCNTLYSNDCPLNITNFCDDGIYCNGLEYCYSPFPNLDILGTCLQQQNETICPSLNMICDELNLTCYNNTNTPTTSLSPTNNPTTSTISPTNSPTISTISPTDSPTISTISPTDNPTSSPTSIITSVSPTNSPTKSPTLSPTNNPETSSPTILETELGSCNNNIDCFIYNNFCQGDYICDNITNQCIPFDINYNPCNNGNILEIFKNNSNNENLPLSIVCVEHLLLCVESFTCNNNNDCQDDLICNGNEECINGICQLTSNQSLSSICGSNFNSIPSNQLSCLESQGCFLIKDFTTGSSGGQATLGVSLTIILLAFVIIVIALIIIWYKTRRIYYNRHHNKYRK